MSRQQAIIQCGHRPAPLGPGFDVVHLDVEDRALDAVHPIVVAGDYVIVFGFLSPIAKQGNSSAELGPIGDHRPAFAIGAEVLAGIKAEAAKIADGARAPPLVFGAVRLRGVLDHDEPVSTGDLHDRIHVCDQAVQMDRQDRLRPRRDRGFDQGGIHRPGDGIDVDEDRLCAAIKYRGCGRDEGHRYGDDLIAGTNASRKQRQVQRGSSAIDGVAMADVAIGRETLLECRDLRSQHELRAVDRAQDRGIDFRLDLMVLSFQIQKRYQCSDPCASASDRPPRLLSTLSI